MEGGVPASCKGMLNVELVLRFLTGRIRKVCSGDHLPPHSFIIQAQTPTKAQVLAHLGLSLSLGAQASHLLQGDSPEGIHKWHDLSVGFKISVIAQRKG